MASGYHRTSWYRPGFGPIRGGTGRTQRNGTGVPRFTNADSLSAFVTCRLATSAEMRGETSEVAAKLHASI